MPGEAGATGKPAVRKRFISDKVKSGCSVVVGAREKEMRDQKLLRMRSTLGGYMTLLQQTPRTNLQPVPPTISTLMNCRPLSSYLSGGCSARVNPKPQLLDPLPQLKGKEILTERLKGSMTERSEGGGWLYHNMARGFFPLAVGLGMRPKSPLVGVGGDIGKILDDSPTEQILPGRSWSEHKPVRLNRPDPDKLIAPRPSVGGPELPYAFELANGSDEKDWWRCPGDLLGISAKTFRVFPKYLISNASWERVVVTLCNLHFLAEKILFFGLEDVMLDLKEACAGLDIECKKFPDMKSWQETYGTWCKQVYEYKKFFAANAHAISVDISVIFTLAINEDWGTCSQDARFELERAQASVVQLEGMLDAHVEASYEIHHIIKVSRLIDHVRIACKHGLHKCCDESGQKWTGLLEDVIQKTTSEAWYEPSKAAAAANEVVKQKMEELERVRLDVVARAKTAKTATDKQHPEPHAAKADKQLLHASLATFLQRGMDMTKQLASATITGRIQPRWYFPHVNDSYLTNDLTRLIASIDTVRGGTPLLDFSVQLPAVNVGLYLSTMGGMPLERRLLTRVVLPAVAKYLARAGIHLSWTDLRSAGPEREFNKNSVIDALDAMEECRLGQHKILAMFVMAETNMLLHTQKYKRPRMNVKKFAASKETVLDKTDKFKTSLLAQLSSRFSNIFEAWTYFDINGDWNVTSAEFVLQYKHLKMPITAKEVLKIIDKDGYGDVDVHEFVFSLAWHDLPEGGKKEAIDKAVGHYQLRRKTVVKELQARLSKFVESANAAHDDAVFLESLQKTSEVDTQNKRGCISQTTSSVSTNMNMSGKEILQEIVQDSVLGPEILEEASRHQGLEWIAAPALVNSRLQRLELEYALIRNSHRCEAIIMERTLPADTWLPGTAVSETEKNINSCAGSTLACVGEKMLQKLQETSRLHKYSLRNTGADMGSFVLKTAFAVIDTVASNLPTEFLLKREQIQVLKTVTEAQRSADALLWQEEKEVQRHTLEALHKNLLLAESKLDKLADIWKTKSDNECCLHSMDESCNTNSALEAEDTTQNDFESVFTREDCVVQLAQWARGEDPTCLKSPADSDNMGPLTGPLQVAVMRGQGGCGLSSVCAMLIRHLQFTPQTLQFSANDNQDTDVKDSELSILYYFCQSQNNRLGPDTYLVSEMRGKEPFSEKKDSQVGLAQLPQGLLDEAQALGKWFVVVIDGLRLPQLAVFLSGFNISKHQGVSSHKRQGGVKVLVTMTDTHIGGPKDAQQLRTLQDLLAGQNIENVRYVNMFEGLNERQRCAMLNAQLGDFARTLSSSRALTVCRLQGAECPEFLCVAAAYMKEVSSVIPIDEAALALERTLPALYEFNVIPLLELIHGPALVRRAAVLLLNARIFNVSMDEFAAALTMRSSPHLLDAESTHRLASSLRVFCNLWPDNAHKDDNKSAGIRLISQTFRMVLARKYNLAFLLDAYESATAGRQEKDVQPHKSAAKQEKSSDSIKRIKMRSEALKTSTASKSSESLNADMQLSSDLKLHASNQCDMDAVRSGLQSIVTEKLLQQMEVRKESKPAHVPARKETIDADRVAAVEMQVVSDEASPGKNGDEVGMLLDGNESGAVGIASIEQDKQITTLQPLNKPNGWMQAPLGQSDKYQLQALQSAQTQSLSQKMEREPMLHATVVQHQHRVEKEERDMAVLDLQRMAMLHEATEERVSSLTHGACLDKGHMWEGFQASQLMPSLDAQIAAAESREDVEDLMLNKHRASIAKMKHAKRELNKQFAGAHMDVIWKAVSVRNLDVSCCLQGVQPGVFTACWHLKFAADICDLTDIYCTLDWDDNLDWAGTHVRKVLTVAQQDAVKTGNWCFVVVEEFLNVPQKCDLVAGLQCSGRWLSGVYIDAFGLVPVPNPSSQAELKAVKARVLNAAVLRLEANNRLIDELQNALVRLCSDGWAAGRERREGDEHAFATAVAKIHWELTAAIDANEELQQLQQQLQLQLLATPST